MSQSDDPMRVLSLTGDDERLARSLPDGWAGVGRKAAFRFDHFPSQVGRRKSFHTTGMAMDWDRSDLFAALGRLSGSFAAIAAQGRRYRVRTERLTGAWSERILLTGPRPPVVSRAEWAARLRVDIALRRQARRAHRRGRDPVTW